MTRLNEDEIRALADRVWQGNLDHPLDWLHNALALTRRLELEQFIAAVEARSLGIPDEEIAATRTAATAR